MGKTIKGTNSRQQLDLLIGGGAKHHNKFKVIVRCSYTELPIGRHNKATQNIKGIVNHKKMLKTLEDIYIAYPGLMLKSAITCEQSQ